MRLRLFIAFLAAGVAAPALAQPVSQGQLARTELDNLGRRLTSITQSADGFIWFGSDRGLWRWDGVVRSIPDVAAACGLDEAPVETLSHDGAGGVWVLSHGGTRLWSLTEAACRKVETGLASEMVNALAPGAPGTLYLASGRRLLFLGDAQTPVREVAALPAAIRAVLAPGHEDEATWLGTDAGLFRWQAGRIQPVAGPASVTGLARDGRGRVWVTGDGAGLYRGDDPNATTLEPVRIHEGVRSAHQASLRNGLMHVTANRHGVWVAWRSGFAKVMGDEVVTAHDTRTPAAAFVDREGNLWLLTVFGDITRVGDAAIQTVTPPRPAEARTVAFAAVETAVGTIWATAVDHVLRIEAGETTWLSVPEDVPVFCPRSLALGRDDELYLSSCEGGLARWDGRGFALVVREPSGPKRGMGPVLATAGGRLLGGGRLGGLWQVENGAWRLVHGKTCPHDPLAATVDRCPHEVLALLQSRDGSIHIGTRGHGLLRMAREDEAPVAFAGLSTARVHALAEDPAGRVWVGTADDGVAVIHEGRVQAVLGRAHRLPTAVRALSFDAAGALWATGELELFHLEAAPLARALRGEAGDPEHPPLRAILYDRRDGFRGPINRPVYAPSLAATHLGVAVPTEAGLAFVRPPASWAEAPARVVITTGADQRFDLPFGRAALESMRLDFTAPYHKAAHRVRFEHRMTTDGDPGPWSLPSESRSVMLPPLSPGVHVFEVRASVDNRTSPPLVARRRIEVRGFYQQGSFFALVSMLGLISLSAVHLLRLRQARARQRAALAERNRIARDVHDTLSQHLAGIGFQLEYLAGILPARPDEGRLVAEDTGQLLSAARMQLRQAIHNLRQQDEGPVSLEEALERTAEQLRISHKTRIEVHVSGRAQPSRALGAHRQREILFITQEAINNAVVHGQPQLVSVSLRYEGNAVRIDVRDDGTGFDPNTLDQERPMNFGLVSMRERAINLGGQVELHSTPRQGTTVKLVFPFESGRNP